MLFHKIYNRYVINISHIQVQIKFQSREKDCKWVPDSYMATATKSLSNPEVLVLSIYLVLPNIMWELIWDLSPISHKWWKNELFFGPLEIKCQILLSLTAKENEIQ